MTRFIRSLLRTKQHEPQYVKIWYFTDDPSDYECKRASKEKVQAFQTTLPDGNKIYTVELVEQL